MKKILAGLILSVSSVIAGPFNPVVLGTPSAMPPKILSAAPVVPVESRRAPRLEVDSVTTDFQRDYRETIVIAQESDADGIREVLEASALRRAVMDPTGELEREAQAAEVRLQVYQLEQRVEALENAAKDAERMEFLRRLH